MRISRLIVLCVTACLLSACEGTTQATAVPPTPTTLSQALAPTATVPPPASAPSPATTAPAPTEPATSAPATNVPATSAPAPPADTAIPAPATASAPAATAVPSNAQAGPLVAQTLMVPVALQSGTFAQAHTLQLPQGFNISVFATGLTTPRWIVTGPDGNLWVTERGAGRVLVYPPQGAAATPPQPQVFAQGLNSPHGIDFYGGFVYVAETTQVLRIKNDNGQASGSPEVVIPGIPFVGDHTSRTLLFTPDNHLLVSIGSSCNVCRESDNRLAAVMIFNPDGSNGRVYASGLRNAVGLALNPVTQQVWFSNNGRDDLGDNIPPDTFGTLRDGAFYGWPDCYGQQVVDTAFGGNAQQCAKMTVAEVQVQAHSAPLGLTFLPAQGWPAPYAGNLISAFHGSFNRSVPTGYKLVRVPMTSGQASGAATDFVTGWFQNGSAWGRPVDVAVGSDGALYVTDDKAGAIYRIFRTGQ